MKNLLFVAFLAFSIVGLSSCGAYKSPTANTGVSSAMLTKIGTTLISDLSSKILPSAGLGNMASKLNMGTKLNSVVKGATMISSFKNMLSNNYGIESSKVDKAYNKFGTLKDVATFVGKNASQSFLSKL